MLRILSHRVWALAASACLSACGGGGGGDVSPPPPPTPTLSADVYPLAGGDRRTWRQTAGDAVGALRHERVGETVAVSGGLALVVRSGVNLTLADQEILQRTASGVTSHPGADADALTRALGPVEMLRFGAAQGQDVVLLDRNVAVDLDGDGRSDTAELRIESRYVGTESVTTSAGRFDDAARVRSTARVVLRIGAQTRTLVTTSDDWYVPGLGPVRSVQSSTLDGVASGTETEEVIAYAVGARRSEAVAPTLLLIQPDAAYSRPDVQLRVDFSEPMDPLSLGGAEGLTLLRDGLAVPATMDFDTAGRVLSVLSRPYPMPDGSYELRHGGGMSDLAGNAPPQSLLKFKVDTRAPRLLSSSPAANSIDAPLTGEVSLTLDEAFKPAPNSPLELALIDELSGARTVMPATQRGNAVVAMLPAALKTNAAYTLVLSSLVQDEAGNNFGVFSAGISFRTDNGGLARPQALVPETFIGASALADIDGDGRPDLVFAGQPQGGSFIVGVRRQGASGSFGPAQTLHSFAPGRFCELRGLAVADFDRDGRADVAVTGQCAPRAVAALMQQPDGSFVAEDLPNLDTDNELDTVDLGAGPVLVSSGLGGLNQHRRSASGWSSSPLIPIASYIGPRLLGDLDGDGRADLVWLAGDSAGTGQVLQWALRQNGGFGPAQSQVLPSGRITGLQVLRDAQARLNLVLAVQQAGSDGAGTAVWLMRRTAAGGFEAPLALPTAWAPAALAVGDLDGDGRADLVVAHSILQRAGVYLQNASGGFDAERLFESEYAYYEFRRATQVLDLNADGRKDALVGGSVLLSRALPGAWPLGDTRGPGRRPSAAALGLKAAPAPAR